MFRRFMLFTVLAVVATAAMAGIGTSASNGIVASATGSGQITTAGELRTFAFTARKYSDGTANGEAQINNRAQGVQSHYVLNCLAVVGNTAYASGYVDRSTNPAFVGQPAIFGVRDNGEGANAPPDAISLAQIFIGGSPIDCTNAGYQAVAAPVLPVEQGNVQVH